MLMVRWQARLPHAARQHLHPGGLLVLNVWYGSAVLPQQPGDRVKVVPASEGKLLHSASGEFDVRHHTCTVRYHLWQLHGDMLAAETRHEMRSFFNKERSVFQQEYYDKAYDVSYNDTGFPDRKIADGRDLTDCWVLNVGGGAGQDLWYLLLDNRVVNLDYAIGGLQAGLQRGVAGIQVDLNARLAGLPFADNTFDVGVCKDILEHLLDPLGVLLEVRRILKPDGYVVVSVPNHFYLPFRLRILFGRNLIWRTIGADHTAIFEEWNYMHIRFFTYRGFRKLLDRAGLRPEKFFWDFGTLAHYHNPEMYLEPQVRKAAEGRPLSRRGKMGLYVLRPVYWLLNLIFPLRLRSWIVGLAPGLLCAGFYVRCVPWPTPVQRAS